MTEERQLGQVIQTARKRAGLTQQALCQQSGLSYSTLAKIERGAIKTPSVFTIRQVALTLGISLDELLGNVKDHRPTPSLVSRGPSKKTSRNGVRFVYFDMNECLVRFGTRGFAKLAEESSTPVDAIETIFWQYDADVCRGTVRDMRVGRIDVDEVEEMLLHEGVVAAGMRPFDACVLVEVERHHVAEAVILATARGDDALVHFHRRPPRRQAEDGSRIAEDRFEKNLRGAIGEDVVVGERFPVHASWPRKYVAAISKRSVRTTRSAS